MLPASDLLAAMLRPEFYPHPCGEIRLLQTHISWVFLTDELAYKIKKPVNFGFLDFSTLARRRHFCQRELELNRRYAPNLYRQLLPITLEPDGYALDGCGRIVEWAVEMARFADDALLIDQLEQGRFAPRWMDELALLTARFHATAEVDPPDGCFGDPQMLVDHLRDNFSVGSHADLPDSLALPALLERTLAEIERRAPLFAARQAGGFIRAGHGDLHLRNIALLDGAPTPFDGIEFNDDYRIIDVQNDVAFLLMDCAARGRPELGWRFYSRYLEQSGDYAGARLLPLFLIYRASVRGKVACLLANDAGIENVERRRLLSEAENYFRLAADYWREMIEQPKPHLYLLGGLSGSGKSHLALLGLDATAAVVIRSDAIRKRLAASYPELPLYSGEMSRLTYAAMESAAAELLAAGLPAILDATFLRRSHRDLARAVADALGIPCTTLWLDLPVAELERRIRARQTAGSDISDADVAVLHMQMREVETPTAEEAMLLDNSDCWPVVSGRAAP